MNWSIPAQKVGLSFMAFPWNGNVIFRRCVLWLNAISFSFHRVRSAKEGVKITTSGAASDESFDEIDVSPLCVFRKSVRLHQPSTGLPKLHLRFKITFQPVTNISSTCRYLHFSVCLVTFHSFQPALLFSSNVNTGNPNWYAMTLTPISRSNLRSGL